VKENLSSTSWVAAWKACQAAFDHAIMSGRLRLAEDLVNRAKRFELEYRKSMDRELGL
jgi:hypothetical protein